MREMIYYANRLETPELLTSDEYKGFTYYVLNLGTHPCAYIEVTGTELDGRDYCDIDIDCHGSLTYSRDYLRTVDHKGWFIGWDYMHYLDFVGYEFNLPQQTRTGGKRWTTEEIVLECERVIEQLVVLLDGEDNG